MIVHSFETINIVLRFFVNSPIQSFIFFFFFSFFSFCIASLFEKFSRMTKPSRLIQLNIFQPRHSWSMSLNDANSSIESFSYRRVRSILSTTHRSRENWSCFNRTRLVALSDRSLQFSHLHFVCVKMCQRCFRPFFLFFFFF